MIPRVLLFPLCIYQIQTSYLNLLHAFLYCAARDSPGPTPRSHLFSSEYIFSPQDACKALSSNSNTTFRSSLICINTTVPRVLSDCSALLC